MAFTELNDQRAGKRDRDFEDEMSTEQQDSPSGKFRRSGDRRMRSDEGEVRILVPSRSAGAVIGKQGSTIKRLREQYKARLNVPDSNGPERVLSIDTDEENLRHLMCEVFQCLVEDAARDQERANSGRRGPTTPGPPEGMGPGMCDVRLLIHQSQAGAVIGRSGAKVKELRENSGLKNLKVFTDPCPNSTDRVVQLVGEPDKCADTVVAILEVLKDAPPKGPIQPYNPSVQPAPEMGYGGWPGGPGGVMPPGGPMPPGPWPPGGAGPYNGGGGRAPNGYGGPRVGGGPGGGGELTTTQVSIPDRMAGAIMGRQGMRIKQIRSDSGAEIKIDPPTAGGEDRIITIRGTPEQIQTAQYLLQMCVKKYGNM